MKFDEKLLSPPPQFNINEMCLRLKHLHVMIDAMVWVSPTSRVTTADVLRVLTDHGNINTHVPPGFAPVRIHAGGVMHMPEEDAASYLNWWFCKLYYHVFHNEMDRTVEWYNATRYVLGDWKP